MPDTTVSLLSFRTFHKVEVRIEPLSERLFPGVAAYQVVNAMSASAAFAAVQQHLANRPVWNFLNEGERPIKEVVLLSVNPLTTLDPSLFDGRTLICNPTEEAPAKKCLIFEVCTREESLHDGAAYFSDGVHVFDWLADAPYGRTYIDNGSMVYVRPTETFTLERQPSAPLQEPVVVDYTAPEDQGAATDEETQ